MRILLLAILGLSFLVPIPTSAQVYNNYWILSAGNLKPSISSWTIQVSNQAAEPSGVNGNIYYNTGSNKFRCFENGGWANCIGGGTGGSFAYPFYSFNDFGTTTSATSSSLYTAGSFFSSSTQASQLPYASTTAISATNGIFTNLSNLTTNGFVKTSGGTGALSIDNGTYVLTAVSVSTAAPLSGGGDLSTSRTITCSLCGTFSYNRLNTFSTTTFSTSSSLWLNGGSFFSSSTLASQFPYASTTAINGGNIFLSADTITDANSMTIDAGSNNLSVRGGGGNFALLNTSAVSPSHTYTFPNSSGTFCLTTTCAAFTYPWTVNALNTFSTTTISTTTSYWTQGVYFSSSTVAASQFPYASTTEVSAATASSTNLITSGIVNALHLAGATGIVSAYAGSSNPCTSQVPTTISAVGALGGCTSINNAWWSGTQLSIANGGTNSTGMTTSGNVTYYTGSAIQTVPVAAAATFPYATTTYVSSTNFLSSGSSTVTGVLSVSGLAPSNIVYSSSTYASAVNYLTTGSTTVGTVLNVDGLVPSYINYASTTALTMVTGSTTNLIVSGLGGTANNCLQTNASGVVSGTGGSCAAGFAFPFTTQASPLFWNALSNSTSTQIHFSGSPISLSASSTAQFSYASSTALTAGALFSTGSTTVGTVLNVDGTVPSYIPYASSTILSVSTTANAALSVGSTTAWAMISISPNGILNGAPAFAIGSSTKNYFGISNGGGFFYSSATTSTSSNTVIDWANSGPAVEYQIGNSAITFTFINATTGQYYLTPKTVMIDNPTTGTAGTITWAGVEFGSTIPTQTTTVSSGDMYCFRVVNGTSTTKTFKIAGGQCLTAFQ